MSADDADQGRGDEAPVVLDLRGLLSALVEHGVDFVVIGGVAVIAHGYVRATEDLDVVPDPARENLDRLLGALRAMDARLLRGTKPLTAHWRRVEREMSISLVTRFGQLDAVQRLPSVLPYSTLASDAVDTSLLGVEVRVCSLEALRDMKRRAGRPQDIADLDGLPDA